MGIWDFFGRKTERVTVQDAVRAEIAPLAAALRRLEAVGDRGQGVGIEAEAQGIQQTSPELERVLGVNDCFPNPQPLPPIPAYAAAYAMNEPRRWRDFSDPRIRPFRAVTTDTLRSLAQTYDVLGSCVAHLKDQVLKTPLRFAPREDGDCSEATGAQVSAARRFFDTAGGLGGSDTSRLEFEGRWLDDLLVLGACALWFDYATLGAQVDGIPDAVLAIDAATIRPLVTAWGFAPGPTEPVYEQVIQGVRVAAFRRDEMVYEGLPIFAQTTSPYFLSPVELLVMVIMTALKSDEWNRTWLTDGNVPDRLIQVPKEWTPTQIREYADYFDALLSGNSRERHRAKMVPEGVTASGESRKEADFQAFDAWLRDRVCALMGVSPASVGHASDTYQYAQDGARKNTRDNRVAQLLLFRNTLYTDICRRKGWDAVQVSDAETDAEDARTRAERHQLLISSGQRTVNECRHADGLDPRPEAGADVLLITGSLVPLSKLTEGAQSEDEEAEHGNKGKNPSHDADEPEKNEPDPDHDAIKAELGRWERKCLNRLARGERASCGFSSDVLPDEMGVMVRAELEKCEGREAIRQVFAEVLRGNLYHDEQGRFATGPHKSAAYHAAKAKAITTLRRHAEEQAALGGNVERQIILDIDTGKELHDTKGEEDRVADMVKLPKGQRLGVLHTHSSESPHQAGDWKTFVQHPHLTESVVVTPSNAYTLNRPNGWTPPNLTLDADREQYHASPTDLHDEYHQNRLRERAGDAASSRFGQVSDDKLNEQIEIHPQFTEEEEEAMGTSAFIATNHKMSQDYGVGFHHHKLPKRKPKTS